MGSQETVRGAIKQFDRDLPKIGRNLLHQLWEKEITVDDFLKECSYWMMQSISDHVFKQEPLPPEAIMNYRDRKDRDPEYKLADDFWRQPFIIEYLRTSRLVRNINHANRHWLLFMKKHIPVGDTINQTRVLRALQTHEVLS